MLNSIMLVLAVYAVAVTVVLAGVKLFLPRYWLNVQIGGSPFVAMGVLLCIGYGVNFADETTRQLPRIVTSHTVNLKLLGASDVRPESLVLVQLDVYGSRFYMVNAEQSDGKWKLETYYEGPRATVVEIENMNGSGYINVTCRSLDPSAKYAAFAYGFSYPPVCEREIRVPRGALETRVIAR